MNSSTYVSLLGFHCQLHSLLLRVLNLAIRMSVESEEEGAGQTTPSNILNLDCSIHLFQTPAVSITHCTFNK